MSRDELAARRWFRNRLKALGERFPELQEPGEPERLEVELKRQKREIEEQEGGNRHGPQTDRSASRSAKDERVCDADGEDT
jgi:hypothetical protein